MAATLSLIGLGPGSLDRVSAGALAVLADPAVTVIVRTLAHPSARELAAQRPVVTCDDLYDLGSDFDTVYTSIADRVIAAATQGPTVYAVPGSIGVGERAIPLVQQAAAERGLTVVSFPGESFLDLAFLAVGVDPIADSIQILDGRSLTDVPNLTIPTIITQVDRPEVADRVTGVLAKVLDDDFEIVVLDALGSVGARVETIALSALPATTLTALTSVFVPAAMVGLGGLIAINEILRGECPWDKKQTHRSLLRHLVEETYEAVEALERLSVLAPEGDVDWVAYAEVEEELGDVLLQVVFHATLANEVGAFTMDEIAEGIRRKLVRRHPHVFGDTQVDDADAVIRNWEALKADEKDRQSLMDDIPSALPALARADKTQRRARSVGFDYDDVAGALGDVHAELSEFVGASAEEQESELGDVLFAVVNLARHISADAESALRGAIDRFELRFRSMEAAASADGSGLGDLSMQEMNELWRAAKDQVG
ncbi:Nucleoside triphosphate pyrophosphohydrolase MazG [hydrothermal vent metagenome]|uniref:Nucleoside triphosphate pyrophosphohydrolase MazG n=1 Tax=hydrothermal vent metagenome TaxID=652676 RepID=A0A3B0RSW7_9ZZZZ